MNYIQARSSKSINKEKEKFANYYNSNIDSSPSSKNMLPIPKKKK